MAANSTLIPVKETGWRRGFANLLSRENGAWWRTRTWLVQTLIWLAILNGILAAVNAEAGPNEGLNVFLIMSGIAPVIGLVIIGQDAIIGEKQSGTAAWILSKPASRTSFILSKLVAHSLGALVTMVIIQGAIAFLQITAAGKVLPIGSFAAALGLIFLNLMFYLTLTLMLGTLFNGRGPVIGIAMALLWGWQIGLAIAPWLGQILPWGMVAQVGPTAPPMVVQVALGKPIASVTPIVATALWSLAFVVIALWRFNREEF